MRDPRRCALHLLLDAPPRRGPEAARPHRARRDRSARGQPWPLRRAQDKGGAVAGRHNRQSQAHLPDNEGNGLVSAYGSKRFKRHRDVPNGADVPNVVARRFGGRAPRTHACSDLTYVRVGGGWNCVCLLVDLRNREIMGHSAGPRKDADLVRAAFATLELPMSDIKVFHTDRGSEFDNAKIDEMLDAFGIERSLLRKGAHTTAPSTSRRTRY